MFISSKSLYKAIIVIGVISKCKCNLSSVTNNSLNLIRYLNGTLKSQCDGYDGQAYETHHCSIVWKLQKNDKVKFQMDGYGANNYSNDLYTFIEGFLAVSVN